MKPTRAIKQNGGNIMKKTLSGFFGTAVVLSLCATTVFAAGPGCGRNFVDANGDGVCDNVGTGVCAYVDADGDGFCDTCGIGFVDADGDGICDYIGSGVCGYVDVDDDGICDNYTADRGCGRGRGNGRGCGGRGSRCGRGR